MVVVVMMMVVMMAVMVILTLCALQLPPRRSCTNKRRRHPPKTKRVYPLALPALSLRIKQTACSLEGRLQGCERRQRLIIRQQQQQRTLKITSPALACCVFNSETA
jgi:hypothetical protein